MDFDLSEELAAVRELARDFAEKEIAPKARPRREYEVGEQVRVVTE